MNINSLTNSTYSVVWHPLKVADMVKHWEKDVNGVLQDTNTGVISAPMTSIGYSFVGTLGDIKVYNKALSAQEIMNEFSVAAEKSSAKDLFSFSFEGLSPAVVGTIDGTTINFTVPSGTIVSDLAATFTHSPLSTIIILA